MASGTGKKRQTTTRKNTNSKKNTKKKQNENSFIRDEITILILFAVSVILMISNFGVGGAVGSFISEIIFGLFGLCAYILPIGLFLITAFSISNKENVIATVKGIAMAAVGFLFCGILQLVSGEKNGLGTMKAFYTYSSTTKSGGGFVGGLLCKALEGAFGTIGTWIILIVLIIVCIVIITERSFISGVKTGSQKVYDSAKVDAERRRVRAQERVQQQEEKRISRSERKVTGVVLDTAIKKDNGVKTDNHVKTDEMKEIKLETGPDLKDIDEMFQIPIHRAKHHEVETEEIIMEEPELIHEEPKPVHEVPEIPFVPKEAVKVPIAAAVVKNLKPYAFPPIRLLKQIKSGNSGSSDRQLHETAVHLQQILREFGVNVTVTDVSCGPAVTRYEVQPDQGVKVSRIVALSDDIKLNLAVADIRIEAPIPGKAAVGIEVPNSENSMVSFRELVSSEEFKGHKSKIAFAVGKDIAGKIMVTDIAKMPHLLIAGATGSGKSVCINTLIMSILYKADPEEVKLIMVDPKVVELSVYNGIPHLLIPVVSDPKKAAGALNWAVAEMTDRYKKFAEYNVRNLEGYNEKIRTIEEIDDDTKPKKLPQIVIIVDELADLMMVAPGEVEDAICRLAQLARAAGIHLIIATQRPSVNVITGLIKANMPSRIAFAVSSGVDSRTIIDMNGAEKLLGKGDMLFYPYGYPKPVRVQGAFVSDEEVGAVVEFLAKNNTVADYSEAIDAHINKIQNTAEDNNSSSGNSDGRDALFAEAGKFIIEKDKASIGMLQRWFKVGFNRAARIMDQLADAGVVGEEAGTKPREILMSMEEFEMYMDEYV